MFVPKHIDQELEKERSKYFVSNAKNIRIRQQEREERKKLKDLKGSTTSDEDEGAEDKEEEERLKVAIKSQI